MAVESQVHIYMANLKNKIRVPDPKKEIRNFESHSFQALSHSIPTARFPQNVEKHWELSGNEGKITPIPT